MFSTLSTAGRRLVLAGLLLGLSCLARAQAPGSGGPTPQAPAAPTEVPLDGGASLLAGGAAYAWRRLRRPSAKLVPSPAKARR